MNKKGFTLVEVIGFVTVLALIFIVAVPSLTKTLKRNEQNKYNDYIDNIKIAAESYMVNQLKEGYQFNEVAYFSLGNLIDSGYVKEVMTNPETKVKLSRETKIKVSKNIDNTLTYELYEHHVLPDIYQQVEYLENTGSQYINTGYKPNQNTSVEIYGRQNEMNNNSLFGVNPYFVITSSNAYYMFRYNNLTVNTEFDATELAKLKLFQNKVYINDNLVGTFNESQFQTEYDALLFARTSNNGKVEENNKNIIYYAKIWDDDVLVRDFIPVYRKKDNKKGLYDLVECKFYINSGTDEFNIGSKV